VLLQLILLFTLLPLVELALLFWIAQHTGALFTLGLVIVTGVVGASLARHQGTRCWMQAREQIERGEMPADSILEGLMILLAGAVLITPGVITDVAGFGLLVPPIRRLVARSLSARLRARMIVVHPTGDPTQRYREDDDGIIDVEHRPADDDR